MMWRERNWITYQTASPYEQSTDWSEDDPNYEKRWENSFGCQNWLPCFETLLLESGI